MITVELMQAIEKIVPEGVASAHLVRRVVRLVADAGGALSESALRAALGGGATVALEAARDWDGLRWHGAGMACLVSLAAWARERLGLPAWSPSQDDDEPTAYHRPTEDSLARIAAGQARSVAANAKLRESERWWHDVRAAVARTLNVATVAEALAHAYPEEAVVTLAAPRVLPRDCARVDC